MKKTSFLLIKITGRIYSKKNSRRFLMRGRRRFSVPSKAYERFQKDAIVQIHNQIAYVADRACFEGPVKVHTDIYIPGKIRVDGDNLHTSLLDVLEAAEVIENDNNVIKGSYEKHPGSGGWGAHIRITEL